jgi:COMPASS component SWD3
MTHHSLSVVDLCWNQKSEILSASYDQTCKIWDTEQSKLVDSYDCDGFVQCALFQGCE